jgi:hypothetical protein
MTNAQAYSDASVARIGFYCDSAMHPGGENGFYWPYNAAGSEKWRQQAAYVEQTNRFSHYYCEPIPANPGNPNTRWHLGFAPVSYAGALAYGSTKSVSLINYLGFSGFREWAAQNAAFRSEWERRCGYDVWLQQAVISSSATTIGFRITWRNTGFSGIHHVQPIDLTFGTNAEYRVRLTPNARLDIPRGGGTATVQYSAARPAGMPNGNYPLALALPDNDSRLAGTPEFAVRLNNQNINWFAGRNVLNWTAPIGS